MTDSNDNNIDNGASDTSGVGSAGDNNQTTDHMEAMAAAMQEAEQEAQKQQANSETVIEAELTPPRSAEQIARTVSGDDVNIEALLKVPVSLSIEVGRTKMALNDLLDTQEGAVIELERLLDEPLDILVNGALIAHGVVVLAEDRFGIQVTDIISLEERARSL